MKNTLVGGGGGIAAGEKMKNEDVGPMKKGQFAQFV